MQKLAHSLLLASCAFLSIWATAVAKGQTISGTITGPDGATPLSNIYVQSYMWNAAAGYWQWYGPGYDYTDENGNFAIGTAEFGTYRIEFRGNSQNYVAEYYDDAPDLDSGADIVVDATSDNSGIDASLDIGAQITGTVTESDGITPIQNIRATPHRYIGNAPYGYWEAYYAGAAWTHFDGSYTIGGLPAGAYRIQFQDYSDVYVEEYYDNADDVDSAMDVVLSDKGLVSDVNASLTVGSRVTGTVTALDGLTALQNIYVYATQWNGEYWAWKGSDYTDGNGFYNIGGLAAGNYRISFNDWNYGLYISESYSNAPTIELGTDIAVPTDATVSNINAALAEYASVAGVVTEADGTTPVSGIRVRLIQTADGDYASRTTGASGTFEFTYVVPGHYYARSTPSQDGRFLGQWHPGVLYIPNQTSVPPAVTVFSISSGDDLTGVDFTLQPAGHIGGTVVGGGGAFPLSNALVSVHGTTYGTRSNARTDTLGVYDIRGLLPDNYLIKFEASRFQDEWWNNAPHRDLAVPLAVDIGEHLMANADLAAGQSPALVEVNSDPSGAQVYLDFQLTTNLTPTLLDVGEIGHTDPTGAVLARHLITVKKAGHPRPSPKPVSPVEAETIEVLFDLTSAEAGLLSITTHPTNATVFVDTADATAGLSPIVLGNLAPGSHVILLHRAGSLTPRPILAVVENQATNTIVVPLADETSTNRFVVDLKSAPPGIPVYVDYAPTTNVTDVIVDWLDAASHGGSGWRSASHTIMLRKPGFRPTAPRYVPEVTNVIQTIHVNLGVDPTAAVDANHDNLPDQWQDSYQFGNLPPDQSGPQGDPDEDGISNEDEMRAGTNPRDGASGLALQSTPEFQSGQTFSLTFHSVPGRSYLVLCTDALGSAWVQASGVLVATADQTVWSAVLEPDESHLYFRVIVLSP